MDSQIIIVCFLAALSCCRGFPSGSGDTACQRPSAVNCSGETLTERYQYNDVTESCEAFQTCQEDGYFATKEECTEACTAPVPCPFLDSISSNIGLLPGPSYCESSDRYECSAVYGCQKDYQLFAGSYNVSCRNGVWSEPPLCAKIEFYHNNEQVTSLTLNEGDSAVIECRVTPDFPTTSLASWSPNDDDSTRQEWAQDHSSFNLIIDSAKQGTKTYTCSAVEDTTISKTITIKVNEVETPTTPTGTPLTIYPINAQVLPNGVLRGTCVCSGVPKPEATWLHNNTVLTPNEYTIITESMGHLTFTFSELIIYTPTSGSYSCDCSNSAGTVSSAPVTIETRNKREVITNEDHVTDICELLQEKNTVAVIGSVLNHLRSSDLLHVKIITGGSSLEENTIVRVKANRRSLPARRPNILLLKQEGSDFSLQTSLPFSQTLYDQLATLC